MFAITVVNFNFNIVHSNMSIGYSEGEYCILLFIGAFSAKHSFFVAFVILCINSYVGIFIRVRFVCFLYFLSGSIHLAAIIEVVLCTIYMFLLSFQTLKHLYVHAYSLCVNCCSCWYCAFLGRGYCAAYLIVMFHRDALHMLKQKCDADKVNHCMLTEAAVTAVG